MFKLDLEKAKGSEIKLRTLLGYPESKRIPENHDDMITHPEPDILEGKVKWALGRKHHNKQN